MFSTPEKGQEIGAASPNLSPEVSDDNTNESLQPPTPLGKFKPAARMKPAHLDNNWKFSSWLAHSNKEEMLHLLRETGTDVSILENQDAKTIIDYILKRREQRIAKGIILKPAKVRLTKRQIEERAAKAIKYYQASRAPITLETARTYLLAIKRRALLDVKRNIMGDLNKPALYDDNDDDQETIPMPAERQTILYDETGECLISYEAHMAIRETLSLRDNVRYWEFQHKDFSLDEPQELDKEIERWYKSCEELIWMIMGAMGSKAEDIDPQVQELVLDVFSHKPKDGNQVARQGDPGI